MFELTAPVATILTGLGAAIVTLLVPRLFGLRQRIESDSATFRKDLMKRIGELQAENTECRERQDRIETSNAELRERIWTMERKQDGCEDLARKLAAAESERDALQRLLERRDRDPGTPQPPLPGP